MKRLDDFFYGDDVLQVNITKTRIEVESLLGVENGTKFYTLFIHYDKETKLLKMCIYRNATLLKEINTHAVNERLLGTIISATVHKLCDVITIHTYRYYTKFNTINTIVERLDKHNKKYTLVYESNLIDVHLTNQIGFKVSDKTVITKQQTEHTYSNTRELLDIVDSYLSTR